MSPSHHFPVRVIFGVLGVITPTLGVDVHPYLGTAPGTRGSARKKYGNLPVQGPRWRRTGINTKRNCALVTGKLRA